jgi:kynureninase
LTLADAKARDAVDPLRRFRGRFCLPEGVIYLDGNSLGALPAEATARMADAVGRQWGDGLIRSWNAEGWIDAPARVGAKIAPLIGAAAHEVIVADSTSVNLAKLLGAALAARPGRRIILSEPGNFPTDLYIAQGMAGAELRIVARDQIAAAIDDNVAVLMLTHVHYKSAAVHDMAALTAAAQAKGALALWDLSHSVGAVPVDLGAANADLAVGCGYKYLNGGPGAPAFLYVAERHQHVLTNPLSGWMGHAAPFEFTDSYAPAPGMKRWLTGTPPVLALAALEVGIDLVAQAGMAAIDAKRRALTKYLIDCAADRCPQLTLVSPADPAHRGSHVSFRSDNAWPLNAALIARGIIGDFRAPDILRFGVTPLYLGFADIWRAVDHLADLLDSGKWDAPEFHARPTVT